MYCIFIQVILIKMPQANPFSDLIHLFFRLRSGSISGPDPALFQTMIWLYFWTWSTFISDYDLALFLDLIHLYFRLWSGSISGPDPALFQTMIWLHLWTWSTFISDYDLALFLDLFPLYFRLCMIWLYFWTWSSSISDYDLALFLDRISQQRSGCDSGNKGTDPDQARKIRICNIKMRPHG